jgi:Zn-dependent protease with chaperone function
LIQILGIIGLRVGYILIAGLVLYFIRTAAPVPGAGNYSQKRLRHMMIFRYANFLFIIGYVLLVLVNPLWVWLQFSRVPLVALLWDDLVNLILLAGLLLFYLYQSYRLDRRVKMISSSFGSYLMQFGYFWLFVLNIIIFFRVDNFYLRMVPENLPVVREIGVETVVTVLFIGLQLLVLFVRKLKMSAVGPELQALVREVAGHFKVKVRIIRIWRLERVSNAFAAGLIFRGIFLTEELVNSASREDLRMIVGHECAHFKRRHLEVRMIVIMVLLYLGSSLLEGYPDLNWMVYGLYGLVAILIYKSISRAQELDADKLAAKLLGGPEEMAGALARVLAQNATPGKFGLIIRLLIGHPDLAARVKALNSGLTAKSRQMEKEDELGGE